MAWQVCADKTSVKILLSADRVSQYLLTAILCPWEVELPAIFPVLGLLSDGCMMYMLNICRNCNEEELIDYLMAVGINNCWGIIKLITHWFWHFALGNGPPTYMLEGRCYTKLPGHSPGVVDQRTRMETVWSQDAQGEGSVYLVKSRYCLQGLLLYKWLLLVDYQYAFTSCTWDFMWQTLCDFSNQR